MAVQSPWVFVHLKFVDFADSSCNIVVAVFNCKQLSIFKI